MAKEVKGKKETKEVEGKTYHLSKRASDNKWQVKYAGGKIAIKLFDTKEEALEYTKKMAKNQNRAILVHASKGKSKGKLRKC